MTRRTVLGLTVCAPLWTACTGIDFLSSRCDVQVVAVEWPVQIRRGDETTTATLSSSVARADVGSPAYGQLRAALVDGTLSQDIGVVWNVPAFGGGGAVALMHRAVLAPTGSATIQDAGGIPGWGVTAAAPVAQAGVRTPGQATVTGGTIQQLGSAPSTYRISIDARESSGAPVQIVGDARFSVRTERRACY